VRAPWPAARPTLAFLQLLLGPADAAFSGHLLLGILDPADELVSGQRRDVLPGIECRQVGDQRLAQVCGKRVHHPPGTGCSQGHGSGPRASLFHQLSATDRLGAAGSRLGSVGGGMQIARFCYHNAGILPGWEHRSGCLRTLERSLPHRRSAGLAFLVLQLRSGSRGGDCNPPATRPQGR
jgi:hypothetical protein